MYRAFFVQQAFYWLVISHVVHINRVGIRTIMYTYMYMHNGKQRSREDQRKITRTSVHSVVVVFVKEAGW